jgi:transposase InsO family protein
MATHLRTELVLDALNMALWQCRPRRVIHHSDQGCPYTSLAFGLRCQEAGVRPSTGSVGDVYDCDDRERCSTGSDTAYDWPRALALICRPSGQRDTRAGRAGRDLMGA